MFESFKSPKFKKGALEFYRHKSAEELLDIYRILQEMTKKDILERDEPKRFNPDANVSKDLQSVVSVDFSLLDIITDEIKRRGLDAPTMKERGV